MSKLIIWVELVKQSYNLRVNWVEVLAHCIFKITRSKHVLAEINLTIEVSG